MIFVGRHLWMSSPGTPTETLELVFITATTLPHAFVLTWAVYTLMHRIKTRYGSVRHFNSADYRVALNDIANNVKRYFPKARTGYQKL